MNRRSFLAALPLVPAALAALAALRPESLRFWSRPPSSRMPRRLSMSIDDPRNAHASVVDLETGEVLTDCLSADVDTGEVVRYAKDSAWDGETYAERRRITFKCAKGCPPEIAW